MSLEEIKVPDIGDVEDVGVVEVLVEPGSEISAEQSIVVLESEKASMEIPAPLGGVVKEVKVAVGDKVEQGTLLMTVEVADGAAAPEGAGGGEERQPAKPQAKPEAASAEPEPEQKSVEGEGEAGTRAAPVSSDVAPVTTKEAPPRRTIPPPSQLPRPGEEAGQEGAGRAVSRRPHASPSVRRLARELGVDLGDVPGSGPHERITQGDVQRYVKHAMSVAGTATGRGFAVPELPEIDYAEFGEISVQPLTKIQKVSGRNLHRAWVTVPHVTQFDEADITELEEFRLKMKRESEDQVKLTLLSFFMKAVVVVLKDMPKFNSSLDRGGENLVLKHYFHIGIAVDTPNGLVVPVIRDVNHKGLHDLARELAEVSERARARRLSPQDLQGGCFTISSLGGIGGTAFTPIINAPEVAVLGVSRAHQRPVYRDDELVPRLIVPLSLSYDHRVIDGADAARFTTRLRSVLSDIRQMLL